MNVSERIDRSFHSRRYHDNEDRPRRLKAQVLAVLTVLVGMAYLAWASWSYNPDHAVLAWILIVSEALCLWLFIMAASGVWRLRFKPPEGLQPDRDYSVDILLSTCNEPFHVIATTMRAVARIEWKGPLKVHVLDDGPSDEVRDLAASLGFTYLSRPRSGVPRDDAKGGNLNFGFRQGTGELVLVLDADQVPHPDIVTRMAGYMKFPRVAFVQSKQDYITYEDDPFYNRSLVFYEAVELGMDNSDCAVSAGTGVLYRRAALEEIGGFVTWNIVEDLTTSYELHSRGWRSFYFPYALSRGLAPTSIWGVYQQRGQWALDTMRLFFWDNPFLKKGLTFPRRLHYATVAESYIFSAFMLPFFFLLPLWTYLTGEAVFAPAISRFVLVRCLYLAVMAAAIHFMCLGEAPAKQFRHLGGLFPVYIKGILRALFSPKGSRKPAYRVNNSRTARPRLDARPAWLAVLPQMTIMGLNLVLPFYALLAGTCDPRLVAGSAFLSAFAVWTLADIVVNALRRKRWPEGDSPDHVYKDA